MSKNSVVFLILTLVIVVVWFRSLFNFFAQDDFILINNFSQNSFLVDLQNVFGPPEVTHWRPIHNLFFLITGNLFGKFYPAYHVVILLIHTLCAFMVFLVFGKLFKNNISGFFASVVYATHPLHFTSLFWISGGAVNIGFLFFSLSLYLFIIKRKLGAFLFYFLSLLATEAIVVGILIFVATSVFLKRIDSHVLSAVVLSSSLKDSLHPRLKSRNFSLGIKSDFSFLSALFALTVLFSGVKLLFFTPPDTLNVYVLEISQRTIFTFRFYLLRILGFVEGQGKSLFSLALISYLFVICLIYIRGFRNKDDLRTFIFLCFITVVGLFPFVLIPSHLGAHYMVISAFGLSGIIGFAVQKLKSSHLVSLALLFLIIATYGQTLAMKNSWVIARSIVAKEAIKNVKDKNLPSGSMLIFDGANNASSQDQYISLGTGKAIDFWFREKNYKYCFVEFENCPELP
ncbi:MAG: hypothetical protein NUV69_04345 [Candidatus Curtissbacteria bacterium]|nr:hypothetical protein [Candidatus Curtissbacteria bacterium]